MIERYNTMVRYNAIEHQYQAVEHKSKNGPHLRFHEVAHLLRPPTCDKDNKPIFYTPAQWRQWFVDNKLPVFGWTGPVWARIVSKTRLPGKWKSYEDIGEATYADVDFCTFHIVVSNEAGKPPEDYTCEK